MLTGDECYVDRVNRVDIVHHLGRRWGFFSFLSLLMEWVDVDEHWWFFYPPHVMYCTVHSHGDKLKIMTGWLTDWLTDWARRHVSIGKENCVVYFPLFSLPLPVSWSWSVVVYMAVLDVWKRLDMTALVVFVQSAGPSLTRSPITHDPLATQVR